MPEEIKFCSKCGAVLKEGANFCNKCGSPIYPIAQSRAEYRREKQEKEEKHEKQEKEEKHEKQEKEEKHERVSGLTGAIIGGSIIIWLGLSVYLALLLGLPFFIVSMDLMQWNWWALFLSGIGFILVFYGLILFLKYRFAFIGFMIGGAFLLVISLVSFLRITYMGIIILFLVGILIIVYGIMARKRVPKP